MRGNSRHQDSLAAISSNQPQDARQTLTLPLAPRRKIALGKTV
jgi:hypothetical protein